MASLTLSIFQWILFLRLILHLHGFWFDQVNVNEILLNFTRSEIKSNRNTHNRFPSFPFITGDGFRSKCDHICEDEATCHDLEIHPGKILLNQTIFVKPDYFNMFINKVALRLNVSYKLVAHNGDISVPDAQSDCSQLNFPIFNTSHLLMDEYLKGKLISLHAQNSWWNPRIMRHRPEYLHCLPIGLENRQYPIGKRIRIYIDALTANFIEKPPLSKEDKSRQPILLVAFKPIDYSPDRFKVLKFLNIIDDSSNVLINKQNEKSYWFTYIGKKMNHLDWLNAIRDHRFVLAPHGHGLDTHRSVCILIS